MAGDWREQVAELRERAEQLHHGEARVQAYEEAVRLADAHGDVGLAYELRDGLIDAATFGGFPDKALVAFAWCRGQQKKDPERFHPVALLWKQKWVVGRLDEFPHISRKQIRDALEDAAQCFAQVNAGERALLKLRYQMARDMGEEAEAEALWARWIAAPRDHLTDCFACELDDELDHHIDTGDHAGAVRKAGPLLEGRVGCAEVPHLTYGTLLYPLFKLGRMEQARDCHVGGYRLVAQNREFLATVGEHLEFLALTANLGRGLTLLERHLGWALDHASHRDRFSFHAAALLLLELVRKDGREQLSLRLPRAFPLFQPEGTYATGALLEWLGTQTRELAARFDARNGTPRFQKLLERGRALVNEVRPYPIDAARS
jgi:hypothetical protein